MSLIQEALDKTQNKIAAKPAAKMPAVKTRTQTDKIKSLSDFDREIEKKIFELPVQEVQKSEPQRHPLVLVVLLLVLFASGLMYWSQKNLNKEAVPLLEVGIERHQISSKTPAEMTAINQRLQQPVALSPTDSKGLFFLSGIAWGGAQPYAVINGQILRAGEMIDKKAILQSIERDRVVLDYRGETIQLALKR